MNRYIVSVLALALPVVLVGCAAENPEDIPEVTPDAGTDEMPSEVGFVDFSVDEALTSTPWFSVKVEGKGPAGGTLRYTGGAEGLQSIPLDSTGTYCVDVKLRDGENNLKFDAIDSNGVYSENSIFHTVIRQGEIPETEPNPVGQGGTADRTAGSTYLYNADGSELDGLTVEQGAFADLVNNSSSGVQFYGGWVNNESIAFTLPEPMKVTGFEITTPSTDECGPEGFEMYIIDDESPSPASPLWIKVATVVRTGAVPPEVNHKAEGGTYELAAYPRSVWATHFMIMNTNASCGVTANRYALTKIRVFAEVEGEEAPPVSSRGPSCLTGGI